MTISIGILALLHFIRRTAARITREYELSGTISLGIPGILKLEIKIEPKNKPARKKGR